MSKRLYYPNSGITMEEIMALQSHEWLHEPVCSRHSFHVMYGPPGSYKTMVALSLAARMAHTMAHNPSSVFTQGKAVFYCMLEGFGTLKRNLPALYRSFGLDDMPNLLFFRDAPDITDYGKAVEWFERHIKHNEKQPELLIIDTLSLAAQGMDENSNAEMNRMADVVRKMIRNWFVSVLLIHHSGKDEFRGARGASALKATADMHIRVKGYKQQGILFCEKSRETEPFEPIVFDIIKDGDAAYAAQTGKSWGRTRWTSENDDRVLDAVVAYPKAHGGELPRQRDIQQATGLKQPRVSESLSRLIHDGLVTVVKRNERDKRYQAN